MSVYLLVDNGSKKPEATLRLRELAASLGAHVGKTVHPVSLQHTDAIAADELGGQPANTFTAFLRKQLANGEREFIVLPLFFGVSRALTSFIPQQLGLLEAEFGTFSVTLAEVVYPLPEGDDRLAQIVFDHIQAAQAKLAGKAQVVLVDHGSPVPQITEVRKRVAQSVDVMLGESQSLAEAVMERREGKEYDFNGELLADWLRAQAEQGVTTVIVAMLFFLPGRHAGTCGDVETICDSVVRDFPQLSFTITPLISEHSLLLDILKDRLLAAEAGT
jgi:sirohydrochlorin ferrochelatase